MGEDIGDIKNLKERMNHDNFIYEFDKNRDMNLICFFEFNSMCIIEYGEKAHNSKVSLK